MKAHKLVEFVATDRTHGATELALWVLDAIATLARDSDAVDSANLRTTILDLIPVLQNTRPSMITLQNLLQQLHIALLASVDDQAAQGFRARVISHCETVSQLAREMQTAVVETMLALIARDDVIMTHSYSSTVRMLCSRLAAADLDVGIIATESRPGNEGRRLATYAAGLGLPVTFITEAQIHLFMPRADMVVVGADTVLADGSIINKAGTSLMALSARYYGVPCYVCAESFKQKADNSFSLEEMQAEELGFQHPGVEVRNICAESFKQKADNRFSLEEMQAEELGVSTFRRGGQKYLLRARARRTDHPLDKLTAMSQLIVSGAIPSRQTGYNLQPLKPDCPRFLRSKPMYRSRQFLSLTILLAQIVFLTMKSHAQVPIIQPGPPGQPGQIISPEEASNLATIEYTEADIRFLQGMISHHAQAMEMSALAESRASREEINLLADRINLSQEDEIAMMRGWLEDRNVSVPTADAHHGENFELMPGMLSAEEFAELEQASGPLFDRLYLQFMIEHHNGALEMVENLLDRYGSAQDPLLYAFTSDVTADQSAEIERMDTLLASFSPDPRVGLAAGFRDAGEAALNMSLLASLAKPPGFFDPANPAGLPVGRLAELETLAPEGAEPVSGQNGADEAVTDVAASGQAETPEDEEEDEDENADPRPSLLSFSNTDLLFSGNTLVAGNYHGFNIYDLSNQGIPELMSSVVCPGGQGDVSLVGDLLIMSVQETRGRLDCGLQGVAAPVSNDRIQGIRIFDVSDIRMPVQVGAVQTCRGSHTHTVVSDGDRDGNIYVYVSGTSRVRDDEELAGCSDDSPFENPESALFRIEVIEIPVANPQQARIVNRPFIFSDPETGALAGLWRGGDHGPDTQRTSETNQCHDITTFPEIGLAAGACSGNGILMDVTDPANPKRLDEVIDPGFAYWHSATFNNDGSKVIFTDEWGGGGRPRCRAQDPLTWGADAFYDIVDGQLQFRSHFKMPAPQTETENCVAHNGSLIPVPGRDLFVQAWYQGGISVVDFTDSLESGGDCLF